MMGTWGGLDMIGRGCLTSSQGLRLPGLWVFGIESGSEATRPVGVQQRIRVRG